MLRVFSEGFTAGAVVAFSVTALAESAMGREVAGLRYARALRGGR